MGLDNFLWLNTFLLISAYVGKLFWGGGKASRHAHLAPRALPILQSQFRKNEYGRLRLAAAFVVLPRRHQCIMMRERQNCLGCDFLAPIADLPIYIRRC